jgi:exocyst complex component 1
MGIGETEAFSERMKEELLALEATNLYSLLEIEPFVDEVPIFISSFEFFILACFV